VIGDYGVCAVEPLGCEWEAIIAYLITQSGVGGANIVVTVGDNNYIDGRAGPNVHPPQPPPPGSNPAHIANNNARVFLTSDFPPAQPQTGHPPSPPNPTGIGVPLFESLLETRFYANLGNHDYHTSGAGPAKAYFKPVPPVAQVRIGPIELFGVDNNGYGGPGSTDQDRGMIVPPTPADPQDLADLVNLSTACWKIAYMHYPGYTRSGEEAVPADHPNPDPGMRTYIQTVNDLTNNGIDAWLFGHNHFSEYLTVDGLDHMTVGAGGARSYPWLSPVPPAIPIWHDNEHPGFLRVNASGGSATQPAQLESRFFISYQIYESMPEWWMRWGVWTPREARVTRTKDCSALPKACVITGECVPPTAWVKVADCTAYSPGNECRDTLNINTEARHGCAEVDALLSVRFSVPRCGPVCIDADASCPVVAQGYLCTGGAPVISICLTWNPITQRYEGQSQCLFDKWNAPCFWVISTPGTPCKIGCTSQDLIQYGCCTDCAANYP